jgi:hypothetical protein
MSLIELSGPQTPARKKDRSGTVPEVFIIESLGLDDEANARREGAVLAAVLRMCGKNPLYFYIRTKAELKHMARLFVRSGYRYLHISCHGGEECLEMALEPVSYREFAQIFANRLRNRRLFVSACSAGNKKFAESVRSKNKDIMSVAAPSKDIRFDHAVAFWSAFYVKTFSLNAKSMNSERIEQVLQPLVALFDESMHFSKKQQRGKWVHEVIEE